MTKAYANILRREDTGSDYAVTQAIVRRTLARLGQNIPVEVIAVHSVGVNPTGTVDVRPLVHQQDGNAIPVKHGIIYDIPYIRLQGGKCAVICDPAIGDFGYIVISARDISRVKSTRAAASPATFRQWDWSDAVFIGGLLNSAPEIYVQISGGSISLNAYGVDLLGNARIGSGATGTFTTPTGETVSVLNGIITAIE